MNQQFIKLLRPSILFIILCLVILFCCVKKVGGQEVAPLSSIKKGDKGYGLTVFDGTKPERFDFKVLGVFNNGSLSYVLVELSGGPKNKDGIEILKMTKVLSGMSGSPMYTGDGKLIGGIAIAHSFSMEPKPLVTPIDKTFEFIPKFFIAGKPGHVIQQFSGTNSIAAGEMYYFCEYWGDDYSCSAGTVTVADPNDPSLLYTLSHGSGPVGMRALPFWKAEVLTNMASFNSSRKVVNRVGPMLGSIVFNGPFGQLAKIGVMPRSIPMQLSIENYFPTPKVLNYFFAYADSTGVNVSTVILSHKDVLANIFNIDAEIRIDISGLPQIYSKGFLGNNSSTKLTIKEFMAGDSGSAIERINVVLRARSEYKIMELMKVVPTASKNKGGNLSLSLMIAFGANANSWEKSVDLEIDKTYDGKKLYIANGETVAEEILTKLGGGPNTVNLLSKISDRNALYLYYTDMIKASNPLDNLVVLIGNMEESISAKASESRPVALAQGNTTSGSTPQDTKENGGWKFKHDPKEHFAILAKIDLPSKDILVTGQKDFTVKEDEKPNKKKFLFF